MYLKEFEICFVLVDLKNGAVFVGLRQVGLGSSQDRVLESRRKWKSTLPNTRKLETVRKIIQTWK